MKVLKVLGFLWRWSPVVTLPATAVFIHWLLIVRHDYQDLSLRYLTLNNHANLRRIGEMHAGHIQRKLLLELQPRVARPSGGLHQVDLFLSEASEDLLGDDLPHSGRQYVPASLIYPDGDMWEVSVKYRGDFFWHWAQIKKSIRVKTKRKQLYDRMRTFNLIVPKTENKLTDTLGYRLGRRMGLIVPECKLVNVSINGENRGVYVMVEQPDEMILRKNDRMPGDIFAGEFAARDMYRGIVPRLFQQPGLWEKIAINNHFPDETYDSITLLCNLASAPASPERTAALRELLDMRAFGRFAAYRTLAQSDHFDETHNWRLYYDPWRNHFEPIVWDPDILHKNWVPKPGERARPDIITSMFDAVLYQDSAFIVARQKAMEEYFHDGVHEGLLADLTDLEERSRVPLERDPSLMKNMYYASSEDVFYEQRRLRNTIDRVTDHLYEDYMTSAGLRYALDPEDEGATEDAGAARDPAARVVRLEVTGRRPFYGVAVDFAEPLAGAVDATLAWSDKDGPHEVDVSGAVSQRGTRLTVDRALLAQFKIRRNPKEQGRLSREVLILPATYDLGLSGPGVESNRVVGVVGQHGRGVSVNGELAAEIAQRGIQQMRGVIEAVPRVAPEVWSGTMRISGVRIVDREVIIEPGTTLLMEPEATLILQNRLLARGTPDRPIRVVPAGEEPWGVLALRGEKAGGSELAYCQFEGGSGYKVPLSEYSAMFSVHNVPGIVVRDCEFRDSLVVDDMVHTVYSDVHFMDCLFERSLLDAVDLDISEGVVERCRFVESGNDALDLMTSTIVVKDCVFERSQDKGISVGEDTRLFAINDSMIDCEIGFQAKDRSTAIIYNCELRGNKIAIDAYKKNWRYDSGGFAYVYKSTFIENETIMTADKLSRIRAHDSYIDGPVETGRRVRVESTCDGQSPTKPRGTYQLRFPEEREVKTDLFKSYWSHVDPMRRGFLAPD
ncbi:MAG: hypothetical protein GY711_11925 [bacterium]|nr:hypothetical protein [bacterium]